MGLKIKVKIKEYYGRTNYAPQNDESAKIAQAFGRSVYTETQLKALQAAGVQVVLDRDEPKIPNTDWLEQL